MDQSNRSSPLVKSDIVCFEDIKLMVDAFYHEVRNDAVLGPVFGTQVQVNWDTHLPTMYSFWQKVLLGKGDYRGNPFQKHIALKIDPTHFQRWLSLFIGTVDEHFSGAIAEEAKLRAITIAHVFQSKLGLRPQA